MNDVKTNSLASLVAIRAAESAGYFTVGSKKYFANQLEGKRNGQTYRFVKKDTGSASNSLAIAEGDDTEIVETEVKLSLEPWHVAVKTNAIEGITDLDLDAEVAEPNGQKLIQAAVRSQIGKDLGKASTAFVGSGFAPLSQASAHLSSICNEDLYGFVDPNIEAILTSNGQQFVPVNAPDMYSKGLLGKFHGAEYRAQRFIPSVNITETVATAMTGNTITSYTVDEDDDQYAWIVLGTAQTLPVGMVFWIDGVYACDAIGDVTAQEKAWIVVGNDASKGVKVAAVNFVGGSKEVANIDGSELTAAGLAGKTTSCPEAGKYFGGFVRADGAMEFETLEKLDAAGADYQKETVMGVTVHQNKLVDLAKMENITRFDTVVLAGIVEPRCNAYVLIK